MNTAHQEITIRSFQVFHDYMSDGMTPFYVTRYDVFVTNLGGNQGQTVSGLHLFYDNAIALLKLAGKNMKNARLMLSDADLRRAVQDFEESTP